MKAVAVHTSRGCTNCSTATTCRRSGSSVGNGAVSNRAERQKSTQATVGRGAQDFRGYFQMRGGEFVLVEVKMIVDIRVASRYVRGSWIQLWIWILGVRRFNIFSNCRFLAPHLCVNFVPPWYRTAPSRCHRPFVRKLTFCHTE